MRLISGIVTTLIIAGVAVSGASTTAPESTQKPLRYFDLKIQVSDSPNRSNPKPLTSSYLTTKSYIFIEPQGVEAVAFFIDSKSVYNFDTVHSIVGKAPFDLNGTNADGTAIAFDPSTLKPGFHDLIALVKEPGSNKLKTYSSMFGIGKSTTPPPTSPTIPPTTPTTPPSDPTARPGYTLVWNDEFNNKSLDTSNWFYTNGGLKRDIACYQNENVNVSNGSVNVLTKAEAPLANKNHCTITNEQGNPDPNYEYKNHVYPGENITRDTNGNVINPKRRFTTGEITSSKRVNPSTAPSGIIRIDMMAKMPEHTMGVWPGLWTRNELGSGGSSATPYGEADLVEQWGHETTPGHYKTTTHVAWSGAWKMAHMSPLYNTGKAIDREMHLYSVEIDIKKFEVRYYFDNKLIETHNEAKFKTQADKDAFRASLLKGGGWNAKITVQISRTNGPVATTNPNGFNTTTLKVDYVRAYTKN